MQSLADELGVSKAVLYNHVVNRDDVLLRVAGEMIDQLSNDLPNTGTWQERLEQFALGLRQIIVEQPEVGPYLSRIGFGSEPQLQIAEDALRYLEDAGFSTVDAIQTLWLVFRLTSTSVITTAFGGDGLVDKVAALEPLLAKRGPGFIPHLAAGRQSLQARTDDDRFHWELDVLLAGLAAKLDFSHPDIGD